MNSVEEQPAAWLIPGSITRDIKLAKANGRNAIPLYTLTSQPVAYRFTHNRGNGNTEYTYHDNTEKNNWRTAYTDTCIEITPLHNIKDPIQ